MKKKKIPIITMLHFFILTFRHLKIMIIFNCHLCLEEKPVQTGFKILKIVVKLKI